MRAIRTVDPLRPSESGTRDGLAYSLWLPLWLPADPRAGIVVLHGAGSAKESHHDFARAAVAAGLACLCFDARGHGGSDGPMDERALDDVAAMAGLLRERLVGEEAVRRLADEGAVPRVAGEGAVPRIALRGSSMGGYLAIVAAAAAQADAVVAICPASTDGLRRGLRSGRMGFTADIDRLLPVLDAHDPGDAVAALRVPLLLMHAEGDEVVPVEHSRELAARAGGPGSRLITVPGGHHRSVQHDDELQAFSLRWIAGALGVAGPGGG